MAEQARDDNARPEPTATQHPPAESGLATLVAFDQAPTSRQIPAGWVARARDLVLLDEGLHYLAGYGVGVRYFDVDVLRALYPDGAAETLAVQCRADCRKIGRKISFQAARHLNEWLAALETGFLIRTVVRTGQGAIYCDQIVPGQYLIGATVPQPVPEAAPQVRRPSLRQVDQSLALCVADIRQEILLHTKDLGGWESERLRQELLLAQQADRSAEAAAPAGPPELTEPFAVGDLTHPGVEACRRAVSPANLHLVALFDDAEPVFGVDVLNHASGSTAGRCALSATARRERYRTVGIELPAYLRELARTARDVIGGPMVSAVLDVDHGALYYQRLNSTQYLLGVTLLQSEVANAEAALMRIVESWPASPDRHPGVTGAQA